MKEILRQISEFLRSSFLILLVLAASVLGVYRLAMLQIVTAEETQQPIINQSVYKQVIPAARGEIVDAVGRKMKIFVDCGVVSGMDAYKCLALGADAVSVGRHLMPLLREGADATAARIKAMTSELAGVMTCTGVKDLKSMDPTVIHRVI